MQFPSKMLKNQHFSTTKYRIEVFISLLIFPATTFMLLCRMCICIYVAIVHTDIPSMSCISSYLISWCYGAGADAFYTNAIKEIQTRFEHITVCERGYRTCEHTLNVCSAHKQIYIHTHARAQTNKNEEEEDMLQWNVIISVSWKCL